MKNYFLISVLFLCLIVPYASAENETVNERLVRVEQSVKSLDKRVEQSVKSLNKQIEQSVKSLNKRIDDTNARIDMLRQDMNKQNELLRQDMNKQNELLRQDMNKQNELLRQDMNNQLDFFGNLMIISIASSFTIIVLICSLIAYIFYDRKSAAKPANKKIEDMEKAHHDSISTIKAIQENITTLENDRNNFKDKIKQVWDRLDQITPQLSPA